MSTCLGKARPELTQQGDGPSAGRGDCASRYAPGAPPAVTFRAGLAAVSRRGCVIPERAYGCRRDQQPLCIHLLRRSWLHPTRAQPASPGDRARFSNKLQAQQHLRLRYFQYSLTAASHTPAGNGCTPCRAWSGRGFGSAVSISKLFSIVCVNRQRLFRHSSRSSIE